MDDEEDIFLLLSWIRNEIGADLQGEGVITIEQREDKFVLTATIPKDGKLSVHPDDVPRCMHLLG